MQHAGEHVAGVAPLAEPDLEDRPDPLRDALEAIVRRCLQQGLDPAQHDPGENSDAGERDQDEKDFRGYPGQRGGGGGNQRGLHVDVLSVATYSLATAAAAL